MRKEILGVYLKVLLIVVSSAVIVGAVFMLSGNVNLYTRLIIYLFVALYLSSISLYIVETLINPIISIKDALKKMANGNLNFQLKGETRESFFKDFNSDFNKILIMLREYQEKQDVLGKVKSDFVSIAAHQFRRPVTEMRWILKMILDEEAGKLTQKQTDLLSQAYRDNESINFLIDDLLNLSKIEEEAAGYKLSKVNISSLIEGVIGDLKFAAEQKEIEIIFNKPKEGLPDLDIDETKIKLVVYNLIDNSIKYSYNKSKTIVELVKEDNSIKVSVKDSGIGINKKEQGHIFEKFFRASNAKDKERVGTGLGLYIVKSIVERHGGEVGLDSEVNKGSRFWFTLPLKPKKVQNNNTDK